MSIKHFIRKLILGSRTDSDTYVKYLRSIGMSIGERTSIFEPRTVCIDTTRPFLIQIGNDVKITRGVTILTHGYDWNVLAGMHNTVLGSAGAVNIGNNVFLGMNTTILKGVNIGNNVIIGAGSLVNKDIPNNCVAAGNPCKVIMSIEDYYEKTKAVQIKEAFEIYRYYVKQYGKEPEQEVFDEFFFLFHKRGDDLPQKFKTQMSWHNRYEETLHNLNNTPPAFDGYDEFLKEAKNNLRKG